MSEPNLLDSATVSAVIGAISGGLVSWAIASVSDGKNKRFAQYCAIEILLDELQCSAQRYWKKAGKEVDAESSIKAMIESLDLKIQSFSRIVGSKKFSDASSQRVDELGDEITGDEFETIARKRDSVRASRIASKCRILKDYLHGYL